MALNTVTATIQMRCGLEEDLDPNQLTTGEWAVSKDTKYVRMCFSPGVVLRMATYEAFEQDMKEIQTILATCQDIQEAVDAMANLAAQHKNDAFDYANLSKSYAVGTDGEVRENDNTDCAAYYYEQAKRISQGVNGIIPMGTISFADLDNTSNQVSGYFFDISDSFISDNRFKNGSGIFYGAGSNVLRTDDGMWDVTAASMVSGVKGNAENEYRQGFVNITAENIGAVENGADTAENTVTFTSDDDLEPEEWENVDLIESGSKQKVLFRKISTMLKNVRYLFGMLGNADISAIGDGTVTGAINALSESESIDFDKIYPVGSIYISVSDTNPADLFGGTWEAWGTGRVPVGVNVSDNDFKTAEKTGGAKTQTLIAAIGAYDASANKIGYSLAGAIRNLGYSYGGTLTNPESNITASRINHGTIVRKSDGSDASTIQPYITCYMFKRTA